MKKLVSLVVGILLIGAIGFWLWRLDVDRVAQAQGVALSAKSIVPPYDVAENSRAGFRIGNTIPTKLVTSTPSTEYLQSQDLRSLFDKWITQANAGDSSLGYLASRILMDCAIVAGLQESALVNAVEIKDNDKQVRLDAIKKLKQSCRGLDASPARLKQAQQLKSDALRDGDQRAIASEVATFGSQGLEADAFKMTRGLLVNNVLDQIILENAIQTLNSIGVKVGDGIPSSNLYSAATLQAAVLLANCELLQSCPSRDSYFLASACALSGACAASYEEYIRKFTLTPSDSASLTAAKSEMTKVLLNRDWSALGFSEINRPKQTKPSILPADPSDPHARPKGK